MEKVGTLYLIPVPIADNALSTLSPEVAVKTMELQHFFVENVRTARRFLKALHPAIVIDQLQFSEIDKHTGADIATLKKWLKAGIDVGVMSESGCPGIADPWRSPCSSSAGNECSGRSPCWTKLHRTCPHGLWVEWPKLLLSWLPAGKRTTSFPKDKASGAALKKGKPNADIY